MRKILVIAFILVATSLTAQSIDINSLQSTFSYGVFENELDTAASVDETGPGPGFSELESKYLFGGLSNLELVINRGSATATLGNPLSLGYYQPGDTPWSLFSGLYMGDFTPVAVPNVTFPGTLQTKTLTSGDTYDYEDEMLVEEPKSKLASEANLSAQYLMALSAINIGGYVVYQMDDAATYDGTTSNYVATQSYYYDADAGDNTVAPDIQTGYTTTEDNTTLDRVSTIGIGVPVFMSTGDLGHLATLSVDLSVERVGAETTFTYSDIDTNYGTAIGAANYTALDRDIDTGVETDIDIDYELTFPALYGENSRNEFTAGAQLGTVIVGYSSDTTQEINDIEYVVGNPKVDRLDQRTTVTTETGAALGINAMIMANHSFYYDLAESTTFGIVPTATLGFTRVPDNPFVTSEAEIVYQDNNDDGDFTDAGDTLTYTTDNYTNYSYDVTTGTIAPQEIETNFIATLSFPAAVQISPEGWIFGLTIGAEPELEYNLQTTSVATATSSQTTRVDNGDGSVNTAEDTAFDPTEPGYSSTSHLWDATVAHNIGMNFAFAGGVAADVRVNFTNFLELDDLTAQVIIPLQ
jgi:hypothetical protein